MRSATIWSVVLALVLGMAVVPCVYAAPDDDKKPDLEEVFKKRDKDGDGKVSLEEFVGKRKDEAKEKAEKQFKRKDKDSDGFLTLEEFKAKPKKKKEA